MAERRLIVRLGIEDADTVRRALERLGEDGQRALKRIEAAGVPASQGLKAISSASGAVQAEMGALSARLGPVGAALGSLGPAGLAAGAALGGLTAGLLAATNAAAEAERVDRKLEAVLKATGNAVGLTRKEIEALAESRARVTLFDDEAIKEQIALLATFRGITAETFAGAIAGAQDLATVFGGDLKAATLALGKSLQDPAEGLTALRRAGVAFTDAQEQVIKKLVATGDTAAAQRLVLDELARRVGGAAEAESGGLTGAARALAKSWNELLESFGRTSGVMGPAESALRGMSGLFDRLRGGVEQQTDPVRQLAEAQRDVERARGVRWGAFREPQVEALEARAADLGERVRLNARLEQLERSRAQAAVERVAAETEEARLQKFGAEAEKVANELALKRALDTEKEREDARKRGAEIIAADAERNRAAGDYIAKLEETAKLEALSSQEKEVQRALIEAQNKLIDQQGVKLRDLTEEETRRIRAAVIERQAAEERHRRAEEEQRKLKQQAEQHAREIERIIGRSADRIVDFGADAFDRLLSRSKGTWRAIADDLLALMRRTFAQLAAEAVIRPIVQPIVASLVGGAPGLFGASAAAAGTGSALGGGGIFDLGGLAGIGGLLLNPAGVLSAEAAAAVGNAVLGLGLGSGAANFAISASGASPFGIVGSLGASLLGLGGGVGGAVGGGIGSLIGAGLFGPIGAIGGGFLGSAFGGLFGGGRSVGPIGHTNIGLNAAGRLFVGSSGADNGGDPSGTIQMSGAAVQAINAFLDRYGLRAATAGPAAISFGAASGPQSAEAFVAQFIGGRPFAGATGSAAQILATSKATTLEALAGALDFGQVFDTLGNAAPAASALEQALTALNQQFAEARRRAGELGLDLGKLAAAEGQARFKLVADFNEQIRRGILAIADPTALALEDAARVAAQRLADVRVIGGDVAAVERLNALERQRVLGQGAGAGAGGDELKRFFDEIVFGGLSGAAPAASLEGVRASFEAAAAAGERGRLPELGRGLLDLSRSVFASGGGFQSDLARVQEVVGGFIAGNDNAVVGAVTAVGGEQARLLTQLLNEMARVRGEIVALRDDNATLRARLERLVAA